MTSCTKCIVGKYSNATGQTTTSTCINCPLNSHSVAGSYAADRCQCNRGFTGPGGGVCSECIPGTYKILTGSDPCIECGRGKFSVSSTRCSNCVVGTYSNTAGASSSATCSSCPAGTFSQLWAHLRRLYAWFATLESFQLRPRRVVLLVMQDRILRRSQLNVRPALPGNTPE